MAKRPEGSASSAGGRSKKDKASGALQAEPSPATERGLPPRDKRDFKAVMARINRDGWKALNVLSTDLDRSLQRMLVEAMNDYLEKHGRDPVVETRSIPKD